MFLEIFFYPGEFMEKVIGMKFNIEYTPQNIALCSAISAGCCRCLMQNYPVTYSQILYPYADALSLSGKKGAEGTQIFGTHAIFRGIDSDALKNSVKCGIKSVNGKFELDEAEIEEKFTVEFIEFNLIDGNVTATHIREFLKSECSEIVTVGDFGAMLSGFTTHWRIREAARIFASFAEMAYRKSGGIVCGLVGGKLVLDGKCDCMNELEDIFFQKTGC